MTFVWECRQVIRVGIQATGRFYAYEDKRMICKNSRERTADRSRLRHNIAYFTPLISWNHPIIFCST